jgi:hypothetical protein
MPTLAGMVGESRRTPKDRLIDGIDASVFMLGRSKTTGRTEYVIFSPDDEPMSVKWRLKGGSADIKVIFRTCASFEDPHRYGSLPARVRPEQ